jgi:hypothetical protein
MIYAYVMSLLGVCCMLTVTPMLVHLLILSEIQPDDGACHVCQNCGTPVTIEVSKHRKV